MVSSILVYFNDTATTEIYPLSLHAALPISTTEGIADIGADTWQAGGWEGSGVKIAILDPGFSGYDQRIAEGELPPNVITRSFRADGDLTGAGEVHGTACAETVYDVAPGAQIYLVNFGTDVELGNAVDYLISEGVDIVSASWGFFDAFRGDGQGSIDDIVQNANNAGIFWANASGNAARKHWNGPFVDSDGDQYLEFAPNDETNSFYAPAGSSIDVHLTWDRWPVTDQDYDIYLVWEGDPTANVAAGDSWQSGTQAPSESLHYTVPKGQGGTYWVIINNYSADGNADFQLYVLSGDIEHQVPEGSLGGQPSDSPYAMTVGAVPAGYNYLEDFSSHGPTRDGRIKPDIVAPDRTSTSTYGITGFWGTSAAAPHAAGAAALVLGVYPGYTPTALQSYLESGATDLGDPGKDNLYGSGKLHLGTVPDLTPPVVTQVEPSGTLFANDAVVSVYYQDDGSGIDLSSVTVSLDGNLLSGCTATADYVTCEVNGLATGTHVITGTVLDNAGNSTVINGSFEVAAECAQPVLNLGFSQAYWASYNDYLSSNLTVDYLLCNGGANDAESIQVVGSVNTSGVQLVTKVPKDVGDIASGAGCTNISLRYQIPAGVQTFSSTLYVTAVNVCGTVYSYPGPFYTP